jgi:hypothetical protein
MFKRRDWKYFHTDGGQSSGDSDSDLENDGIGALSDSDAKDGSDDDDEDDSGDESSSGGGSDDGDDKEEVKVKAGKKDSEGGATPKVDDSDGEGDDEDEEDEDGDSESESEETPTVLTHTADAAAEQPAIARPPKVVDPSRGIAVKCKICPGVLCLSEQSLQQHLDSKKHKSRMKKLPVGADDPLYNAAPAPRRKPPSSRDGAGSGDSSDYDSDDSVEGYSDGEAETHGEPSVLYPKP